MTSKTSNQESADGEWMSARMVYATELAAQRERSGMTLVQLAAVCHYEQSYLHRLERGQRLGTVEAAGALDGVYGTGNLLVKLWRLAKREAVDRPFLELAPLEADAVGIQEYAIGAVPYLLQTPAYAREQLRSVRPRNLEELDARIGAQLSRQERLTGPTPLHYRVLVDEAVLRRKARDPETWTGQMEHLIEAAQQPDVSLHVVPFGSGPHGLRSCLELIFFFDGRILGFTQSSWGGHLIGKREDIEPLRLAYDLLRDTALTPAVSLEFLRTLLDGHTRNPAFVG